MDRRELEKLLYHGLCEYHAKQGDEVGEDLAFALSTQAEFLAVKVAAEMKPSREK